MEFDINLGEWVSDAVDYITINWAPALDGIAAVIEAVVDALEVSLEFLPPWLLAVLVIGLSLWRVGIGFAAFSGIAMLVVFGMGLWDEMVTTLALVLASAIVAIAIGLPIGISMARNDRVNMVVRPILDLMQTMPPFVYLIPAAMFFGLGKVPGTIATVVFAMPPVVRLTNLGIRQVPKENVEAGLAFGCTDGQLLRKVQLPLALPSIMAGINQTIMLALSMVVIASMIGAGGLGNTVLTGIQRLNVGMGFEGGLGVVILAIILDRITQSVGVRTKSGGKPSPLARLRGLFGGAASGGDASR